MKNLLVELGVEELPSSVLDVIYENLAEKTAEALKENRISFDDIKVEATPRRVALYVENVGAKQADQTLEMSGPSAEKAYDEKDEPTKALLGFLRGKGADLKDVQVRETPKGKFVFVVKHEKGLAASKVLPGIIVELFQSLPFAKFMRWEKQGHKFPRPIRWMAAFLGEKVLSVQIAEAKASNKSYGHRFTSPEGFVLKGADWKAYNADLKKHDVILSLEAREEAVRKDLIEKYGQKNPDEDLIHENAQFVEKPFLIDGGFDKTYLSLPSEVLATCMSKHQKIFACYSAKGKLENRFVAVLNGRRKGIPKIVADYENVLVSRLKDAKFFYDADMKKGLDEPYEDLQDLVYLKKLGSMKEKCERLQNFAADFCGLAGKPDLSEDLKRVCYLAKSDLLTQMVYEFPELQGVVGGEYALKAGENKAVAEAIAAQYLPKNLSESHKDLSKQIKTLGALYGVLDRLDLLVGAFGTGTEPTGSQDPFALRRAGGSLVKIIRALDLHFSIPKAIEGIASLYGDKLDQTDDLVVRLSKFLRERLIFELGVKPGQREYEILDAVMSASFDDLADVYSRFEALRDFYRKEQPTLFKATKVVQRTSNIIKGKKVEWDSPRSEHLAVDEERKLFELLNTHTAPIHELIKTGDFHGATREFEKVFYEPIHAFFDHVMVHVDESDVRNNRMSLMKAINRLYTEDLADLSVLSRIDEE